MSPTILVLGASGRTGLQLIRAAANHPSKPAVHAFVRTPSKLPDADKGHCASVVQGDAVQEADLTRALHDTKADVVVVAVGTPNVRPTDVREKSAKALLAVVKPGGDYEHVRVVVISSMGSGGTKIKIGLGIGSLLAWYIRNPLKDHDAQEDAFQAGFTADHKKKLLIVRPTGLADGKPTGKIATFAATEKPPSGRIDRADVSKYILDQICGDGPAFGTAVNITTAK